MYTVQKPKASEASELAEFRSLRSQVFRRHCLNRAWDLIDKQDQALTGAKVVDSDDRAALTDDPTRFNILHRQFAVIDFSPSKVKSASAAQSSRVTAGSIAGMSDSALGS